MSISNHPVEQEQLMVYLDGELSPDRAAETASHLEHCPECQKLAAELSEVSQMLMSWQVDASEPSLSERLAEELDERQQEKPDSLASRRKGQMSFLSAPRLLWAGGLAAAAVIIIAISMPNLLRSRFSADEAARMARERQQAKRGVADDQIRKDQKTTNDNYRPEYGRNHGSITGIESHSGTSTIDGSLPSPPPSATPRPGEMLAGKLDKAQIEGYESNTGPMIVRTAELALTTNKFDQARAAVEEILKRHRGYVGELNVNTPTGSAKSLTGALRIPALRLDAALIDFKALGRVEKELQGGEEVTQKYVDLQARLTNSRHTEKRLTDMLRDRTGKLADVLSVEMQISRVRGEIEQMEAERKGLKNQVDYATLNLTVAEDYKAELKVVPPSTSTQIRNAAVDGYRSMTDGLLGLLLWLISVLPTLLVWCALLFFPARFAWKKLRPRFAR